MSNINIKVSVVREIFERDLSLVMDQLFLIEPEFESPTCTPDAPDYRQISETYHRLKGKEEYIRSLIDRIKNRG